MCRLEARCRSLVAGLLHDTVEDTATSLHNISNLYGDKVAELVDGLSKVDQLVYKSFEEKTAENFRKMLLATAADARVILIKLADRLHNMQTLSALSKKKKRRISKETLEIFAPIAHRLGFNEVYRNWKICVLQICIQKGTSTQRSNLES